MTLEVVLKDKYATAPKQNTNYAAGYDLYSCEDVIIPPGERVIVNTGIVLGIPVGFEGQIRPRSGMALKNGITVLNSPGTIDSDYRGPEDLVKVLLYNTSDNSYEVKIGDRIAQLIINKIETPTIEVLESTRPLDSNRRGGFGHTGR